MQFRMEDFLNDYNIPFIDSHSILTSAYLGLETCPMCGKHDGGKPYAAVRKDSTSITCWACKGSDFYGSLKVLTGITDRDQLNGIYKKYGNSSGFISSSSNKSDEVRPTTIDIPGSKVMSKQARAYIEDVREFPAEYLWEKHDLRVTSYQFPSYKIIIPITYNNRIVSYTSRDWSGSSDTRVQSCAKDLEIVHHKDIFLGIDQVRGKNALVVEGPWDFFRVGNGSLSSFGSEITLAQIMLLSERFDTVFFMPDGKEKQALDLYTEAALVLQSIGTNAEIIELSEADDPDNIFKDPNELIYLKKDLQLS